MVGNLDLTSAQVARVLEQAVRVHAALRLEARPMGLQGRPFRGTILAREHSLLRIQPDAPPDLGDPTLLGAFCDVELVLSGELYQFSTCIVDVGTTVSPTLLIAIPPAIQVANRRRYVRRSPNDSLQVSLHLPGADSPLLAELLNVAPTGLAVRGHRTDLDDVIFVGDGLRVGLDIPPVGEAFDLPAIICGKSLDEDKQRMTVGLEFEVNATPSDLLALNRFRAYLCDPAVGFVETDGAK